MTDLARPATPESVAALLLSSRASETTRTTYGSILRGCAVWAGLPSIDALARLLFTGSHRDAQRFASRWKESLVLAGKAPATINRNLAALRSLVSLGRAEGVVAWTLELPGVRQRKYRDIAGPTDEQYTAILAACADPEEEAVVRLMGDAGLRSCEVRSLDATDVDEGASRVIVRGKGAQREPTPVPLAPETLRAVLAHLGGRRTGPFLSSRSDPRATRSTIRSLVARVARRVGVRCRPHALRHRCATALARATGDPFVVKAVLRHADVRTSVNYCDLAGMDLASVMARTAGKAKKT